MGVVEPVESQGLERRVDPISRHGSHVPVCGRGWAESGPAVDVGPGVRVCCNGVEGNLADDRAGVVQDVHGDRRRQGDQRLDLILLRVRPLDRFTPSV